MVKYTLYHTPGILSRSDALGSHFDEVVWANHCEWKVSIHLFVSIPEKIDKAKNNLCANQVKRDFKRPAKSVAIIWKKKVVGLASRWE